MYMSFLTDKIIKKVYEKRDCSIDSYNLNNTDSTVTDLEVAKNLVNSISVDLFTDSALA